MQLIVDKFIVITIESLSIRITAVPEDLPAFSNRSQSYSWHLLNKDMQEIVPRRVVTDGEPSDA